ncbi:MAG: DNA topoisomerase IV subunit A [Pseudomonadota bacterium]
MADDALTPDMSDDDGGNTVVETLARAIGDRYLQYALSTIMHRALPDARDGLKPVHRRIMFAMRELRLAPEGRFRKSSKISGDVMGNYHPHGDQAIYDAMARLAQDFSVRYPLVDGQGNFGSIDGDNPAAARYTEARLTAAAQALMEGLAENAVDFRENYEGTLEEPVVLPGAFPNLLANGANGIAVGMATSIPTHNVDEVIGAALHLIKHPGASTETLLTHMPGPDLPTGGTIVETPQNILDAYETGRGGFRVRSVWHSEDLGRGQWQAIVTEIPYQVQKSKLIERIADLITAKKLPILADVRDESAEDIRIVLEPRAKTVDPAMLMEALFKTSDLEVRVSLNMNVLIDGRTPQVCGLREVLRAWLDHQRDVLLRRSRHRLEKIDHRLEVLEGYIIAFLNLDRVIEIIRNEDEPKPVMIAEFELTDTQAEAILNMRLRSLRKLEEMELRRERDDLYVERADLEDLLGSDELQWTRISDDLKKTREAFGAPRALRGLTSAAEIAAAKAKYGEDYPLGARRTGFGEAAAVAEVSYEAMIEKEPVTVVCSAMGWIRAMKGHLDLTQEFKFKDGDGPRFAFHAQTTDKLLLLTGHGRIYTLGTDRLPGGRGMGEPLSLMVDLPGDATLVALRVHRPEGKLLLASNAGDGFIVPEDDVLAQTRTGKQVMTVKEGIAAIVCTTVDGDHVAVAGENRKVLVFPLTELPEMTRGKGVRLQKYKDGGLTDAVTFTLAEGLSWPMSNGNTRHVPAAELEEWIGKRASAGRMAPRGFPRDNLFHKS